MRYCRLLLSLLAMGLITTALAQAPAAPAASPVPITGPAVGDLLVAPTRVIFEGRMRTTEVTLINIGTKVATYRISFIHQRMTEAGTVEAIEPGQEKPEDRFVDDLVRFTPRQVVLEPRVAQTLRLQVRKPEGLADGEYRSHLLFRAVPEATPPASPEAAAANQLAIQLRPIYGVSIPVIVRQGATSAQVSISDLKLDAPPASPEQPQRLNMRFNRTGNASTYGDVIVSLTPASGGKPVEVGKIGGIAVYPQNASRLLQVSVAAPAGLKLEGLLRVIYRQKAEAGGAVLAEATLQIP